MYGELSQTPPFPTTPSAILVSVIKKPRFHTKRKRHAFSDVTARVYTFNLSRIGNINSISVSLMMSYIILNCFGIYVGSTAGYV